MDTVKTANGYEMKSIWSRNDLSDTSILKLSTATGYIYGYVQDELKANGVQPGPGQQGYGCDIPDDLCYQWAEDYFRARRAGRLPGGAVSAPAARRPGRAAARRPCIFTRI